MKNIPTEKLQTLDTNTGELIREINEGIRWVDAYLRDEEPARINYHLKHYRRQLKNIRSVLTKKTVISLFGKSQVGKSYLVDGLLSTPEEKVLSIPDFSKKDAEHRFIGELNPPGGKESTGVVSRFSIDRTAFSDTMPIEIRLLSPKDIILILCDAWYSDIKYYKKIPSTAEIVEWMPTLESLVSSTTQGFLIEDDVYDIMEYLSDHLDDKPAVINLRDAKFWDRMAGCIANIPPEKWPAAFELLWGRNQRFSQLFTRLINELRLLDFSGIVHTHFDALLVTTGSILDVERLFELNAPRFPAVEVQLTSGRTCNIARSSLAALTYEVTIPIKEKLAEEKPFLKDVDILDFPGARAREMSREEDLEALEDKDFFNFYRRGKVAYLFNRYTKNYEISSLLFCIDAEQLEVKNLPTLLYKWIKSYIGADATERTKTLAVSPQVGDHPATPLFIVFTKANLMLQYKPIDEKGNFDYKWETRLISIFSNEYCKSYDWHTNWVQTGSRQEKFKNIFLLRSFNYAEEIYEGFQVEKKETGISESRKDYMRQLHDSFVSYSPNKEHYHDTEKSWSEFTELNKDGSEYIISNLIPIANNGLRTSRYLMLLNQFKSEVLTTLGRHHKSDAADGRIRQAARESAEIHARMNIIFGEDAYHFGSFIERFTLSETDVFDFYHERLKSITLVEAASTKKYQLIRESSPRISNLLSHEENLEILRQDYKRDSIEETKEFFKDVDLDDLFYGKFTRLKNNSEILAEGARDYWIETRLNLNNFQSFIDLGFDKHLLQRLLDNFKIGFERLHLTKTIAENIRLYVDSIKHIDEGEEMIAHITSGIVNEYVNSVGWNFFSKAEKQKIRETNIVNNLNLAVPEEDGEPFRSLARASSNGNGHLTVEKLIGFMDNLNENLNRIPIDIETIRNVPMIKNYRRWRELMKISFIANCNIPSYNVAANQLLGEILQKIEKVGLALE